MQGALQAYITSRGQGGVDVRTTVELLRRYAFLERSCIRALAGWFLVVPPYEAKIALGHQLWAHAERVDALRRRLHELRGGHRDASIEPMLQKVGEELLHAPDHACFLAGLRWVLAQLAAAYHTHVAVADVAANAMEIRLLQRLVTDVERAMASTERLYSATDPEQHPLTEPWTNYLASLLVVSGGISGLEPRLAQPVPRPATAHFERPRSITFDERIQHADLPTPEQKAAQSFDELRVSEFQIFFNEFYAAALLATIIYDAWHARAPWEFFFDMCHHFWDEVRHAEFGLRRLHELGIEPTTVNQEPFEQAQNMPFLQRLCYLALGLEVFFMPRKQPRVRRYEAAGDFRSQLFADVDWSDEQNHVRYGKRWVDYFLEDDARTIADLQEEISAHLKLYQEGLPAGQLVPW
jgi:hypothetical protein